MPSAPKWLFDAVDLLISKLPMVTISDIELLSPSLKKIRFEGDFKKLNLPVGSYIDFRVNETDARRYTVSHFDVERKFIETIVHLHGAGPGRQFMDNLKIGDKISMNKPRGERNYYDSAAEQFVIFGDETSLGLACSFQPVLKKDKKQFQYYLELGEENKLIHEKLGLENCSVFPKNGLFQNENWLTQLPIFQAPEWQHANFILTGNAKSAQTFRKIVKQKTKAKSYLHGYWLEGKKGL